MNTIEDVLQIMEQKTKQFEQQNDTRVVFQRVYWLMTKEMKKRVEEGFFRDAVWIERLLVRFASYYFRALELYEQEDERCPKAWIVAFDTTKAQKGVALQYAFLGMNAHINRDLPFVLEEILIEDGAWPDARIMLQRRKDHERVNDILGDLVDKIQRELGRYEGWVISALDTVMGRKDEAVSKFLLAHCRGNVWNDTELLLNEENEEERKKIIASIEKEAELLGKQLAHMRIFKLLHYTIWWKNELSYNQ